MKFDELKECSRCSSDACYSQEITKDINIELCYGCGFQSNSLMLKGSEFFNQQFELLPELYKVLMDEEDDTGKIWMPTTINIKDKGMIFAEGSDRLNWRWAAVQAIHDEESGYKTDMKTLKNFKERDFMDALSYIGVLPE